jgi:hypothetical protein
MLHRSGQFTRFTDMLGVEERFYLFGRFSVRGIFAHENMFPCLPSRRNFGESTLSLDADGLTEAPLESPHQVKESPALISAGDLSVSSSSAASSSDSDESDPLKDKEKEDSGVAQVLQGIAASWGISVAIMFLTGPIMKLFKRIFNKNDDTTVPDTGAQNEALQAPARGALNRGGELAQEGAHESSRSSITGALAPQKDIS